MHDGGDGGGDTEENSFSDSRHRHHHQGEAAIRHHGFLYLFHHPHRRNMNRRSPARRHPIPYYIYSDETNRKGKPEDGYCEAIGRGHEQEDNPSAADNGLLDLKYLNYQRVFHHLFGSMCRKV